MHGPPKGARLFRSFPRRGRLRPGAGLRRVVARSWPGRAPGQGGQSALASNERFASEGEEASDAKPLYERIYCARGTMENRTLKTVQRALARKGRTPLAPRGLQLARRIWSIGSKRSRSTCTRNRTSCKTADALTISDAPLYLSAVASELMHALRRLDDPRTAYRSSGDGVCKGNVWNGADAAAEDRGAGSGERAAGARGPIGGTKPATGYPYMNVFFHAWRNLRAGPEGEPAV